MTVKNSVDQEQLLASLGHGTVVFTWHLHDHRVTVLSGQVLSAPWFHFVIHLFILSKRNIERNLTKTLTLNSCIKRLKFEDLEASLVKWVTMVRENNSALTGPLVLGKASEFVIVRLVQNGKKRRIRY